MSRSSVARVEALPGFSDDPGLSLEIPEGDQMPSTVEVMAEAFQQAGTPFIVGHPGGESVELMQAVRERGMRFILVKQESAGAMLAATWGDITGAPGVCMSTRAPGAANMVNGVTHA